MCNRLNLTMLEGSAQNSIKLGEHTTPSVELENACEASRKCVGGVRLSLAIEDRAQIGEDEIRHVATYIHGEPSGPGGN